MYEQNLLGSVSEIKRLKPPTLLEKKLSITYSEDSDGHISIGFLYETRSQPFIRTRI